jgi:hypothetical protein
MSIQVQRNPAVVGGDDQRIENRLRRGLVALIDGRPEIGDEDILDFTSAVNRGCRDGDLVTRFCCELAPLVGEHERAADYADRGAGLVVEVFVGALGGRHSDAPREGGQRG